MFRLKTQVTREELSKVSVDQSFVQVVRPLPTGSEQPSLEQYSSCVEKYWKSDSFVSWIFRSFVDGAKGIYSVARLLEKL